MKQGEIWQANLNPIEGSEQAGFRPVLIISGNLANEYAPVIVCCPLTTKLKNYKGNPILEPNKQNGLKVKSEVMTIHIRSLSKNRLKKRIGVVPKETIQQLKDTLNDLLNY
ncbi:MAG: type II toxin-antitoxin system PemK/MazF family toxin [Bacteroidota bacterium]|nr:type II toxin-antitoxin system PemK/MazF family toxin [Bacteroidota bacterium]